MRIWLLTGFIAQATLLNVWGPPLVHALEADPQLMSHATGTSFRCTLVRVPSAVGACDDGEMLMPQAEQITSLPKVSSNDGGAHTGGVPDIALDDDDRTMEWPRASEAGFAPIHNTVVLRQ